MPFALTLPTLEPYQWAALYFAAFCVGLAKTGVPGVGIVAVGLFPMLLPPREAVGSVLLLLIGADVVAVLSYRKEAEWKYLWRLFPWAAAGVVSGYLAMGRMNDTALARLIGGILLLLAGFQLVQRLKPKPANDEPPTLSPLLAAVTGILAGFTTMIANAAGPIMILYLLAMRLPKVAFVATASWFFFSVNLFKVPFGIHLNAVTVPALHLALTLFPGALIGGLTGRVVLKKLDQRVFEWLALIFTVAAGLKLALG
jgi:uncharacterized protein